jgi:hypothetical protein
MNVLDEWTRQAMDALGLEGELAAHDLVLDVAREVAHGVARPAAPLTTYLLGVAVGGGASLPDAVARLTRLASEWQQREAGQ